MSSSTHCKLHGHDPDYECPYCKDAVLAALKTENERLKTVLLRKGWHKEVVEVQKKLAAATRALEEIREVYAGMDGFIPETCPEGYQQRLLKRMYDIAVEALHK